jgi:hypothetical protein
MKALLLSLILSFSINAYGQISNLKTSSQLESNIYLKESTNDEEYLYMTKGYKTQIENGLDTKKGYSIKTPIIFDFTNYSFNYYELIRESSNASVGHIVKATSKVWGNVYYFAIPFKNKELLNKSFEEINKLDEAMTMPSRILDLQVQVI